MLQVSSPYWLILLPLAVLLWWLIRRGILTRQIEVPALFLWRELEQSESPSYRSRLLKDWLPPLLIACIGVALAQPAWIRTLDSIPEEPGDRIAPWFNAASDCPEHIAMLVAERNSIAGAERDAAQLMVNCNDSVDATEKPALYLDLKGPFAAVDAAPWWSESAGYLTTMFLPQAALNAASLPPEWLDSHHLLRAGETPLIVEDALGIRVALDLENSVLQADPVYPVLLFELMQRVADQYRELESGQRQLEAARTDLEASELDLTPLPLFIAILILACYSIQKPMPIPRPAILFLLVFLLLAWADLRVGAVNSRQNVLVVSDDSNHVDPASVRAQIQGLLQELKTFGVETEARLLPLSDVPDLADGPRDVLGDIDQLVLLSPGTINRQQLGALRAYALKSGAETWRLSTPAAAQATKPALRSVQAPLRAASGDRVPVTTVMNPPRGGRYQLDIALGNQTVSRQLELTADEISSRVDWIEADTGGHLELSVSLGDGARNDGVSQIRRGISVSGKQAGVIVSGAELPGELRNTFASLLAETRIINTRGPAITEQSLAGTGNIILNNVAIADLHQDEWETILRQVKGNGSYLLVLGGDRSFYAGGYRHSRLESILPVLSAPRTPQDSALVVFLLDHSGSMGEDYGAGASRLALANRAATQSAATLLAGDTVALVGFADQATLLSPPRPQPQMAAAIRDLLPRNAQGASRLELGLSEALALMESDAADRKYLVIVTDGLVELADPEHYRSRLARDDFQVIAYAIAREPGQSTLSLLVGDQGHLYDVASALELPELLPATLNGHRAPVQSGMFQPESTGADPRLADYNWPPVARYPLTRAVPTASTQLTVGDGDPLMATRRVGAGRVTALTAGLQSWAPDWKNWEQLTDVLRIAMANGLPSSRQASIGGSFAGDVLELALQTESACADATEWTVSGPNGEIPALEQDCQDSHQCRAMFQAQQEGRYLAAAECGHVSVQQFFYLDPISRLAAVANPDFFRLPGVDELIKDWPREGASYRQHLLITSLLLYLAVLLVPLVRHRRASGQVTL